MGIFTRMTVVNINNITDPNVSLGNKRLLAAAINTTAALIEEGAQPDLAAAHALEKLLTGFADVLEHHSDGTKTFTPEYEQNVKDSIKFFKKIFDGR